MQSSETRHPSYRFPKDRPLERLSEDRLECKGFVERLASDIMGWDGKDSLVVSLEAAAQAIKGLTLTTPEEKAANELLGRVPQRKQAGQPYDLLEINAENRRRGGRK